MTKTKSRWGFIDGPEQAKESVQQPELLPTGILVPNIDSDRLRSLPRRGGRTAQKTQLNIRVPKELKRLAMAQAALEGRSIGDLVEDLLIKYLDNVGIKKSI